MKAYFLYHDPEVKALSHKYPAGFTTVKIFRGYPVFQRFSGSPEELLFSLY
jgi:hypothetical protein